MNQYNFVVNTVSRILVTIHGRLMDYEMAKNSERQLNNPAS